MPKLFSRTPRDLICALLLLLAAVGYYLASLGISRSALADEVGATGLPNVYAAALAALAIALVIKSFLSRRFAHGAGRASENDIRGVGVKLLRASGMLAIGVGYVAVVNFTGYALTLVAVIALVAVYQGERMGWRLAGIAVGGGVLFFCFFNLVLGIDMPAGFWPALAGR